MFHLRQIEPVIAVCAHHFGVTVIDLTEEFSETWIKLADPGAQGRLHELLYCKDLPLLQKRNVFADCGVEALRMFGLARNDRLWWKLFVLFFFDREKRICSRQLTLHESNLLLPGVG